MDFFGFRVKKRVVLILSLLILGGLGYIVFVEEKDAHKTFNHSLTPRAEFAINGFQLFESLQNGRDWNLRASFAEVFKDKKKAYLKDVRVTFFNSDGRIFKLSSEKAELNMKKQEILLSGTVRVLSDDGYSVLTPEATFFPESRIISGSTTVRIEGPEIVLSGRGFRGDLTGRTFSIFKDVSTEVRKHNSKTLLGLRKNRLKKEINLKISSGRCNFDTQANKATYSKGVIAKGSGFHITSSKMIINYELQNQRRSVKTVLALGRVRIHRGEKSSSSEKALLETSTRRIVLTGEPALTDRNNVVKGEKIVYNYFTEKFQVLSATGEYASNPQKEPDGGK